MSLYEIVINRPVDHHKGPKEIARIAYGEPVPPGLIIGKGALITIVGPRAEDLLTATYAPVEGGSTNGV